MRSPPTAPCPTLWFTLLLSACAGEPANPTEKGGDQPADSGPVDTGPLDEVPLVCEPFTFSLTHHFSQDQLPTRIAFEQAEHGAGVGDLDLDGDLDLFIAYEGGSLLAINDGTGNFSLDDTWTVDGQVLPPATVANLQDLDADGDLDVYLGRSRGGPDLLLYMVRPGEFTAVEVPGTETGTRHANLGDVDGDGDLDLVVAARPWAVEDIDFLNETLVGEPNHLLLNEGGTFVLADERLPTEYNYGVTFQASLLDAEGDGDLDIYSANDGGYQVVPNQLWLNDGTGHFTNSETCACDRPMYAMGAGIGDFNGDFLPDIYVSNIGPQLLLMSDGPGLYADLTLALGAAIPQTEAHTTSWGIGVTDFDRDGFDDLYVTFGRLAAGTEDIFGDLTGTDPDWVDADYQMDVVLRSGPDGRFTIEDNIGLDVGMGRQRSVVFGDVDHDGDDDAIVVGKHEVRIWKTEGGCPTGLRVRIAGPSHNPHGHGTRVSITRAGHTQTRWLHPERMHGSDDPSLLFGLAGYSKADRIDVLFPDGTTYSAENVVAGELVVEWGG